MTPTAILAIPDDQPERLFRSADQIAEVYRRLAKEHHPDLGGSSEVFAKISRLHAAAKMKAAGGTWDDPGIVTLRPRDSKQVRIKYRARRQFELGTTYVGQSLVTHVLGADSEDLVLRGVRMIGTLRYPNEKFREALEPYMPKTEKVLELEGGGWAVVLRKDPDDVMVSDLVEFCGGRMDPRHTCWIVSSVLNLLSYLETQGVAVNGLTPSTVYANPRRHSVSFLGGWWYAAKFGHQITHLPPETYRLAPAQLRLSKKCGPELDLACAKWVGRCAMGDPVGSDLRLRGDVRKEVAEFLLTPGGRSAVKEYQSWYEVLGDRKFVKLAVSGDDVYPPA